jgi:phosphoribosylamine---glycine ligase
VRILVVGGGGREHALVRALRRSPAGPEVLAAPGNPGMADDARLLEVGAEDVDGVIAAARDHAVDLVVVGPEAGVTAFGPSAAAASLEGSKVFAKEVMAAAGVPTASATEVREVGEGIAAITGWPTVLKADGLAAGKGVVIAADEAEARAALESMLVERRFGDTSVLVEEHLEGEELSLLALCDGERAVPMAPAQDYKRIFDGDEGPNTGGMGSYSPVPGIDSERAAAIAAAVHQPVVDAMRERGAPFHGVLYAGLMLTAGGPKVLEFNVRFGDPETQAVLPRLHSDLVDVLQRATLAGGLAGVDLEWDPRWAVTLVLASAGYPASSSTGDVIAGLDEVPAGIEVTHAGTARRGDGAFVTAGGRVLNVTALGDGPVAARDAAYAAADMIRFDGRQLRRDIALRAVERVA